MNLLLISQLLTQACKLCHSFFFLIIMMQKELLILAIAKRTSRKHSLTTKLRFKTSLAFFFLYINSKTQHCINIVDDIAKHCQVVFVFVLTYYHFGFC